MGRSDLQTWVPHDTMGTREETATLLVGTAKEHGLVVRHHVASTVGGYFISDQLAELAFEDSEPAEEEPADDVSGNGDGTDEDEAPAPTTKKTSGNKAAKKTSQEGE